MSALERADFIADIAVSTLLTRLVEIQDNPLLFRLRPFGRPVSSYPARQTFSVATAAG